jgi:hypothetical protein
VAAGPPAALGTGAVGAVPVVVRAGPRARAAVVRPGRNVAAKAAKAEKGVGDRPAARAVARGPGASPARARETGGRRVKVATGAMDSAPLATTVGSRTVDPVVPPR